MPNDKIVLKLPGFLDEQFSLVMRFQNDYVIEVDAVVLVFSQMLCTL